MPELPEVETIRSQLSRVLPSQVLTDVIITRQKSLIGNHELLIRSRIIQVRRYSKLLIIDLSNNLSLAIHLKMTGRLVFWPSAFSSPSIEGKQLSAQDINYQKDKHTHIIFQFESGDRLFFHDQRTFGYIQVVSTSEVEQLSYVKTLGPEFFRNLSETHFIEIMKKSKKAVKTVLLDQHQVGGVGNIYANEGLWMAGIHPEIPANTLTETQSAALFTNVSDVMKMAIVQGGTSSDNFRDAYGKKGNAFERLTVYGREGKPCLRCGNPIRKYIFGGRGTYVCGKCQKSSSFPKS